MSGPISLPVYESPAHDPVTILLEKKRSSLEEILATMITPSDYVRQHVLGSLGRSYITNSPKLQITTYLCAAEKKAYARVFFSPLAASRKAPEYVSKGAISSAIDCCMGTSLIGIAQIGFTAWLEVIFCAPIAAGEVVLFTLEQDDVNVNGKKMAIAKALLTNATMTTVYASASALFIGMGEEATANYNRQKLLLRDNTNPAPAGQYKLQRHSFPAQTGRTLEDDDDFVLHFDSPLPSTQLASATYSYDFFYDGKILARLFWSQHRREIHGHIFFTLETEGPPGRVHGGAIACAFLFACECLGDKLFGDGAVLSCKVNYRAGLPLGSIVKVVVREVDHGSTPTEIKVAAVLLAEDEDTEYATAEAAVSMQKSNSKSPGASRL
jgi:acyl-coenzyme A thioesterase PaaI-like protein